MVGTSVVKTAAAWAELTVGLKGDLMAVWWVALSARKKVVLKVESLVDNLAVYWAGAWVELWVAAKDLLWAVCCAV